MSQDCIQFAQAGFSYDGDDFVFQALDLTIPKGQFVAILGGNGSGKSTLAKCINGLLVPEEGKVTVLGRDTDDDENLYFIRSQAGMVFQNPDDQLVASIIENEVAFGPENMAVPSEELRQRVSESLREVGLQGFERRETASLSGGQKQRVAIAGVLAMHPVILILDEASAMLDPRGRTGLMKVLAKLHNESMTIVMITHFMEEAAVADRVVVLDQGVVRLDGTPDSVLVRAEELSHLNLCVPFSTQLCLLLQQRGVAITTSIHEDAVRDELIALREDTL